MKPDNILSGFRKFNPPYRFIVGCHLLWDKKENKFAHVVDDPATAYIVYEELKRNDKGTTKECMWEWFLIDSFNTDAHDFCKKQFEIAGKTPEELLRDAIVR